MSKVQHHLHYNPLLHTENYISFIEKESNGAKFKFSFYFFTFNIFWLLQKKLFGLIPLWFLTMTISLQFYYFLLGDRSPMDNQALLLLIIAPHLLFSCFIYKIQKIYTDNIIWKNRNNLDYLLIRLKPYNILGFSLFTIATTFIVFSYFIKIVTNEMAEQNRAKAFIQLMESQSPENRAKVQEMLRMIEEAKKNNAKNN